MTAPRVWWLSDRGGHKPAFRVTEIDSSEINVELRIEVAGDVVEREELLNGTQVLTLEGACVDGGWTLSGVASWNVGLSGGGGEGDIILTRSDASELYATLAGVDPSDDPGGEGEVLLLRLDVDGGAGEFESTTGAGEGELTIAGASFQGWLSVRLKVQG
jgi:hypothetical protein